MEDEFFGKNMKSSIFQDLYLKFIGNRMFTKWIFFERKVSGSLCGIRYPTFLIVSHNVRLGLQFENIQAFCCVNSEILIYQSFNEHAKKLMIYN